MRPGHRPRASSVGHRYPDENVFLDHENKVLPISLSEIMKSFLNYGVFLQKDRIADSQLLTTTSLLRLLFEQHSCRRIDVASPLPRSLDIILVMEKQEGKTEV